MEPRPLRIAYAIEFLLALIAFFECWSQISGQAPLDVAPSWIKLLFALWFSFVTVKLTAAAVRNETFPSVGMLRWAVALVLTIVVIALATYYYHLQEPPDDNSDEPVPTSFEQPRNAAAIFIGHPENKI